MGKVNMNVFLYKDFTEEQKKIYIEEQKEWLSKIEEKLKNVEVR